MDLSDVGYKLVVNKHAHPSSNDIEQELRRYLPQIAIETDIPGGDVVFRTNQLPDERFVRALRKLDGMKKNNQIKTYGVQNSTMDDVFLKISRDSQNEDGKGSSAVNLERIGRSSRRIQPLNFISSSLQMNSVATSSMIDNSTAVLDIISVNCTA